MNNRKKVLAVLGVVSVLFASFAMLVYAAAWTADDMAAYMQNIGRHKIYQTNWILYNQIDPKLDILNANIGQGLEGSYENGNIVTSKTGWVYIAEYYNAPYPKKISVFVDLSEMKDGDVIVFRVMVSMKDHWKSIDPYITYSGAQTNIEAKLVVDKLPIWDDFTVAVWQSAGNTFSLDWYRIVEEV